MLSGYSTFDEEFGEPLLTIGIGRKNCEIVVDSCKQQFCTAQILASHAIFQGWVQQEGALTLRVDSPILFAHRLYKQISLKNR